MSFNTSITSPQYTKLRSGQFACEQHCSLFSNRIILHGQVTSDLTQTNSWITFDYDVIDGDYTDVEGNQTVWFGTTDDITKAFARGRVHPDHAATNTTLTTNESDLKLSPAYFFWVVDVWEVWDRLSRPVGTPVVQYVDYDEAYHPPTPQLQGLQYVYAGYKSETTGKFRVSLSFTATAIASGASIASVLVTPRAGQATLISGSYSTTTVVFDLDPSTMAEWGETWFTVTATDSNGTVGTRKCGVKIADSSHPPNVSFDGKAVQGAVEKGYTARLPAFAGVDDVLPWTLGVLWRWNEMYGYVTTDLGALNNIEFIGYLRKDDPGLRGSRSYGVATNTTFEMVDVAGRLASIECQQLALYDDAVTQWDHIVKLGPRRAILHLGNEHSTLAWCVDITFDTPLSSDDYEFPVITTPGDNLLSAMNGIAQQVNAMLEFAMDGRVFVPRDLRYQDATARSAATVVANFTIADAQIVINGSRNYEDNIGIVDTNGAGVQNGNVTGSRTRSPGVAQGISQGRDTLANQILAAGTLADNRNELSQRGGDTLNIKNFQETLSVEFGDGYTFLIPSKAQWYTFTISSADYPDLAGVMRFDYDDTIRWLCMSVDYTHTNKRGTRAPQATFQRESRIGDPGFTIVIPDQPTASILPFPFVPSAFPNFDPVLLPPAGVTTTPPIAKPLPAKTNPIDGNLVLTWTAAQAWITNNFIAQASPTWYEITPTDLSGFSIKEVIANLFTVTTHTPGGYLLASDGSDSAVWYTTNLLQKPPSWTKGTEVAGEFNLVRLTGTPGGIMIYGSDVAVEPIPPPANCIAAADFNRFASTVAGTIVAAPPSGGHVAAVALSTLGAPNVGGGLQATVRYTFTTAVTVTSADAYWKAFDTGIAFIAEYFDAGGGSLWVKSFGTAGPFAWSPIDILQHASISGVKHIDVSVRSGLGSGLYNWISDLEICYT